MRTIIITQQDRQVFLSPTHPNLSKIGSPRTKACTRAYRESQKRKQNENGNAQQEKAKKIRRLLVTNQIRSEIELLALQTLRGKKEKKIWPVLVCVAQTNHSRAH